MLGVYLRLVCNPASQDTVTTKNTYYNFSIQQFQASKQISKWRGFYKHTWVTEEYHTIIKNWFSYKLQFKSLHFQAPNKYLSEEGFINIAELLSSIIKFWFSYKTPVQVIILKKKKNHIDITNRLEHILVCKSSQLAMNIKEQTRFSRYLVQENKILVNYRYHRANTSTGISYPYL